MSSMKDKPELSKETFLLMAEQLGLDTDDIVHMDEVYGHVKETMKVISALRELDLGETEPSNVFSPSGD